MSEDRFALVPVKAGDPIFLSVTAGMTVIVQHLPKMGFETPDDRWWMADVICVEGARDALRCRPCFKSPMSFRRGVLGQCRPGDACRSEALGLAGSCCGSLCVTLSLGQWEVRLPVVHS